MFAAVLARLAMPEWIQKIMVMVAGVFLLLAVMIGYHKHVYNMGARDSDARHAAVDERNRALFNTALATANGRVLAAQTALDDTFRNLSNLERNLDHEKAASAVLQSDLAAGRQRLRIAITRADAGAAKSFDGPGVAELGEGTSDFADIAPGPAQFLEKLRFDHNAAADRLDACIAAYDAVKLANDRLK